MNLILVLGILCASVRFAEPLHVRGATPNRKGGGTIFVADDPKGSSGTCGQDGHLPPQNTDFHHDMELWRVNYITFR